MPNGNDRKEGSQTQQPYEPPAVTHQERQPYEPPAIMSEEVFETLALACSGKTLGCGAGRFS